jgi:predicted permease
MSRDEVRQRWDARLEGRRRRHLSAVRAVARVVGLLFPRDVRQTTPTLADVAEHRWRREATRTQRPVAATWRTLGLLIADAIRSAPPLWMSSLALARHRKGERDPARLRRLFTGLPGDFRLAGRALRARPGFSLLVIATLGLGIGASTAAFDALDRAILRPLPLPHADRLVILGMRDPVRGYRMAPVAGAIGQWRAAARTLERIEIADLRFADRRVGNGTERTRLLVVSPGLPDLIRTRPVVGRMLGPADGGPDAPVVMISEPLWRRETGGDPSVLGRTVVIDRRARTIVGVWPAHARLDIDADAPAFVRVLSDQEIRADQFRGIVGLMRPDVSTSDVADELGTLRTNRDGPPEFVPEARRPYEALGPAWISGLWLAFAGATVLLAVSILNTGHLIAARARARRQEIAVRLAIGGSTARVARLVLVEGLVFGVGGVALGTALAWLFETIVAAEQPWMFASVEGAGLAGRALMFSGIATLAAVVSGALGPVLLTRSCTASQVIDESRGERVTSHVSRGRAVAAAVQAALAVALVSGAALMGRSFRELITTDTGIEIERLAVLSVRPTASSHANAEATQDYLRRLRDSIAATPGVAQVTSSGTTALLSSSGALSIAHLEGEPEPDRRAGFTATASGPIGYLETVGARLVEGRFLSAHDPPDAVVVSESFARRRSESVIGRRLVLPWASGPPASRTRIIVGVVADARMGGLTRSVRDTIYSRSEQLHPQFIIRTSQEPTSIVTAVRARAAAVDPSVPIDRLETGMDVVRRQTAQHRLLAILMGVLGALGLALAMSGLYGIVSLEVGRRTREMGIRMALGATAARLSAHVLRYGLVPVVLGAIAGAGVTMALAPRVQSLLFEVPARDPWSAVAGILIVTVAAAIATLVPARRASRIDPAKTLRA